ncbi:MAG: caspase family protein [Pseudomonadota bacterium]
MLKGIFAALALTVSITVPQWAEASFERKVALVVGNAAYENATPLANPVRDAKAMAAAFERLGFEVVSGYDLSLQDMNNTIREFRLKAKKADLTTFFYAGHALQASGQNYIVPVDARFQDDAALDFEAVKVDFVMRQMRNDDGVSLVFLDACRDNPLARTLGPLTRSTLGQGLAQMDIRDAGRGLAIAFATSPGEVAYDGVGENSPFTTALLKHIETEGADIQEVMSKVTGEVLDTTEERQRPWMNASLTGPVVLKPQPASLMFNQPTEAQTVELGSVPAPGSVLGTPTATLEDSAIRSHPINVEAERALFEFAHKTGKLSHYEAYMETFPNGLYAVVVKSEIARLKAEAATGTPVEVAALTPSAPTASDVSTEAAAPALAIAPAAAAPAPAAPVAPVVQPAALVPAGTEETELALGMDRNKRREVQRRLNMADANVGGADGIFGPRTRSGITFFQKENGFEETGFLNAAQLEKLESATAEEYAAFQAQQRAAAQKRKRAASATRTVQQKATVKRKATKKRATKKRVTKRRKASRRKAAPRRAQQRRVVRQRQKRYVQKRYRRNHAADAAAAAFVGGVVGGLIGGAIR